MFTLLIGFCMLPRATTCRRDTLILVNSRAATLRTLGLASARSILHLLGADVAFVVAELSSHVEDVLIRDVCDNCFVMVVADTTDQYPPRDKVLKMWRQVYAEVERYELYVKVDDDTFLNPLQFPRAITAARASNATYLGKPGVGLRGLNSLSLQAPYCVGMGYVIKRTLLEVLGRSFETLLQHVKGPNSDVNVGRLIWQAAKESCCELQVRLC